MGEWALDGMRPEHSLAVCPLLVNNSPPSDPQLSHLLSAGLCASSSTRSLSQSRSVTRRTFHTLADYIDFIIVLEAALHLHTTDLSPASIGGREGSDGTGPVSPPLNHHINSSSSSPLQSDKLTIHTATATATQSDMTNISHNPKHRHKTRPKVKNDPTSNETRPTIGMSDEADDGERGMQGRGM